MEIFNELGEYRLDYVESKGEKYILTQYFDSEEKARAFIREKSLFTHKLVKEIPLSIRVDAEWLNEET
jgi:hypothetical protein